MPSCKACQLKASEIARKWSETLRLIKVKELAGLLNVSAKTLYQWAELRQIPHIKLNGSLRFNLADIDDWINSCKKDAFSVYNPAIKLEARKGGKKG